jgi:hypothetical protein
MANSAIFCNNNELVCLNYEEGTIREDYENILMKQTAADAILQYSCMIMHSLSTHEHPFKMKLRMLSVISELPHSMGLWFPEKQSDPKNPKLTLE